MIFIIWWLIGVISAVAWNLYLKGKFNPSTLMVILLLGIVGPIVAVFFIFDILTKYNL